MASLLENPARRNSCRTCFTEIENLRPLAVGNAAYVARNSSRSSRHSPQAPFALKPPVVKELTGRTLVMIGYCNWIRALRILDSKPSDGKS
jgi:hypothetical protein